VDAETALREAEAAAYGASHAALHAALAEYRVSIDALRFTIATVVPLSFEWEQAMARWRRASADVRACWSLCYGAPR
jgi:hypothetical protein